MTLNYSGLLPADSYDPGGFASMTMNESSPDRLIAQHKGRMLIRQGSIIRGIWKNFTYDLSDAIQAYRTLHSDAGSTTVNNGRVDRRIAFDINGNAYTLVKIGTGESEQFLCCSTDYGQTWTAYLLSASAKHSRIEFNDSPIRRPLHPPAVLLFSEDSNILLAVLPEISGGVVTIPTPIVVTADKSILEANHTGAGNSVLSIGDDTVLVSWPHADAPGATGSYQYVTAISRATQAVVSSVVAAITDNPDPADRHDISDITADSNEVVYLVLGTHHGDLRYTFASAPYTDWVDEITIDAKNPSGGGHTYPAVVIDAQDRLHIITRDATTGYEFNVIYNRRETDGTWATPQKLVDVGRQYYTNPYYSLSIDQNGRLIITSPGLLFSQLLCSLNEEDTYDGLWPGELPDLGGGELPCYVPGGGGTWTVPYTTQTLHGPFILISEDGGDSWTTSQIEDIGMSYLDVRTALAPVVTWRCDDASAGLVSSTGADNLGTLLGSGHLFSRTGLVPELVGVSTSVLNGTTSGSGFYSSSAGANTRGSSIRSVELWFNPGLTFSESGSSQDHFLFSRWRAAAAAANGRYSVCLEYVSGNTAKIGAYWNDGTNGDKSSVTDSAVINKDSTYHVVCTYETGASGITIYVNGAAVAATNGTDAGVGTEQERLTIGCSTSGTRAASGTYFDEVSVYDYALTAADVLALYNGYYPATGGVLNAAVQPVTKSPVRSVLRPAV